MTLALLLLALSSPACAWELGNGAGVDERSMELRRYWRPFNGTMVDRDMVKRSAQEEEPDWVTREKEKMTPPDRPFGRVHGFTMRMRDVRFLMVGRYGPLSQRPKDPVKERVYALRMAEGAAVETLWRTLAKAPEASWELVSSAPGREAYSQPASLSGAQAARVVWHPLDFYREPGKDAEFYVLLYADKPRPGVPRAPGGAEQPAAEKNIRFMKGR